MAEPAARLLEGRKEFDVCIFVSSTGIKAAETIDASSEIEEIKQAGALDSIQSLILTGEMRELEERVVEQRPRVLHMITHGDVPMKGSMHKTLGATNRENGGTRLEPIPFQTLSSLINSELHNPSTGTLQCLILQACGSLDAAYHVAQSGIPYVICWTSMVENSACQCFSRGFYRALVKNDANFVAAYWEGIRCMVSGKKLIGDPNLVDILRGGELVTPLDLLPLGLPLLFAPDDVLKANPCPQEFRRGNFASIPLGVSGHEAIGLGVAGAEAPSLGMRRTLRGFRTPPTPHTVAWSSSCGASLRVSASGHSVIEEMYGSDAYRKVLESDKRNKHIAWPPVGGWPAAPAPRGSRAASEEEGCASGEATPPVAGRGETMAPTAQPSRRRTASPTLAEGIGHQYGSPAPSEESGSSTPQTSHRDSLPQEGAADGSVPPDTANTDYFGDKLILAVGAMTQEATDLYYLIKARMLRARSPWRVPWSTASTPALGPERHASAAPATQSFPQARGQPPAATNLGATTEHLAENAAAQQAAGPESVSPREEEQSGEGDSSDAAGSVNSGYVSSASLASSVRTMTQEAQFDRSSDESSCGSGEDTSSEDESPASSEQPQSSSESAALGLGRYGQSSRPRRRGRSDMTPGAGDGEEEPASRKARTTGTGPVFRGTGATSHTRPSRSRTRMRVIPANVVAKQLQVMHEHVRHRRCDRLLALQHVEQQARQLHQDFLSRYRLPVFTEYTHVSVSHRLEECADLWAEEDARGGARGSTVQMRSAGGYQRVPEEVVAPFQRLSIRTPRATGSGATTDAASGNSMRTQSRSSASSVTGESDSDALSYSSAPLFGLSPLRSRSTRPWSVVVVGGRGAGPTGVVEEVNPLRAKKLTKCAEGALELDAPRSEAAYAMTPNGIAVLGGVVAGEPDSRAFVVHPMMEGQGTPLCELASLRSTVYGGAACWMPSLFSQGGLVLSGGWRSGTFGHPRDRMRFVSLYDAARNRWTSERCPMRQSRHHHAMVACPERNCIMALGGYSAEGDPMSSCEIWDPRSRSGWESMSSLQLPRGALAATMQGALRVWVSGGEGPGCTARTTETLDLRRMANRKRTTMHSWTAGPRMQKTRQGHALVAPPDNSCLLAIGGYKRGLWNRKTVEVLPRDQDLWYISDTAKLRHGRAFLGAFSVTGC